MVTWSQVSPEEGHPPCVRTLPMACLQSRVSKPVPGSLCGILCRPRSPDLGLQAWGDLRRATLLPWQ